MTEITTVNVLENTEIKKFEIYFMTLDDILNKFSLSGRYYVGFMLMIIFVLMSDYHTSSSYVFTANKVEYWCADGRFGNDSCASVSNSTEQCAEWVYDEPTSFVAEFQLACQEWKRTLVGSAQAIGYGVGLFFIGPLSDRWGRKMIIVVTAICGTITGVAKSFSYNYWVFIILEFLGNAIGTGYSPAYILMIEMVSPEKRVLTSALCTGAAALSYIYVIPLLAWLFTYWRHLLLVFHGPTVLFISYIFLLDESPRWLLSKGRKEEAILILEKIAKICKVELDRTDLDNMTHEIVEEANVLKCLKETFTSQVLIKRFSMCLIWWNATAFINYGARLYSVFLPGTKYINFGLTGVASLFARMTMFLILKKFTRKIALIITFILCAVVFIAQSFTPDSIQWLSILLFMFGSFLVTTSFAVTYIFTSELFPTHTRNSTHSLCSSLGRIGSILAPQTPLLMVYWHGLPSLLFGAVSLLAGVVTLFAPDTSDEALPDNVRQAESIGHSQPAHTGIDNHAMVHETIELKVHKSCSKLRHFGRRDA